MECIKTNFHLLLVSIRMGDWALNFPVASPHSDRRHLLFSLSAGRPKKVFTCIVLLANDDYLSAPYGSIELILILVANST